MPRQTALAAASLLALAACDDASLNFATKRDGTAAGIRTLSMFSGAVRVRGPEGYCIDRRASRARTGFAVLAGCARVSDAELLPSLDGFLTVQVGEPGSALVEGNEDMLAGLLREEAGRRLLSESGSGSEVTVYGVDRQTGLVVVQFADAAALPIRGVDGAGWRAFMDLGDRLAIVSLRGLADTPLSDDAGDLLIRAAAVALRDANAADG